MRVTGDKHPGQYIIHSSTPGWVTVRLYDNVQEIDGHYHYDEYQCTVPEQAAKNIDWATWLAAAKGMEEPTDTSAYAVARENVAFAREIITDEQAALRPALFDQWEATAIYAAGDRRTYNGLLYKCLLAHTGQAGWKPDAAPSLWVRIDDPAEEWPEWRQPESTNPYAKGAKVTYKGKRWISTADNNVWEPGAYGWTEAV